MASSNVSPMETESFGEATMRFNESLTRGQWCVRKAWPPFLHACIVIALTVLGVGVDMPEILRNNYFPCFWFCLIVVFIVDLALRLCHRDRQASYFMCCLFCDATITTMMLLPVLLPFPIDSSDVPYLTLLRLVRIARILVLLRMKDLLIAIHKKSLRSTSLLYTMTLATLAVLILLYFFALVLRVKTIVINDESFDSIPSALKFLMPFAIPAVGLYVLLSIRSGRSLRRALSQDSRQVDLLPSPASGSNVS